MSNGFNEKDYGEYFSELQKRLEKQNSAPIHSRIPEKQTSVSREGVKRERRKSGKKRFNAAAAISAALVVIVLAALAVGIKSCTAKPEKTHTPIESQTAVPQDTLTSSKPSLYAETDQNTKEICDEIESPNVIFINTTENRVVASRNADKRCYPASTTKIMTVLVAAEMITDFSDTFTMSYDITDPLYRQNATVAGFSAGEKVNMTDLLYGAILPSGADATTALALKLGGSEEGFAALMNKKAGELGLKQTHFTNASGLFDEQHYTTAQDMAVILEAAMQNELCRKILSTYKYTTAQTPEHPEGIELTSTLFSYMYGTEPEHADITGGKTGFTSESKYCIASFGVDDEGDEYVCVTLGTDGHWPAVFDQIEMYSIYNDLNR